MSVSILEFPAGTDHWRVDMLGKIVRSQLMDSEPQVAVHLTQLKQDYENPISNTAITSIGKTCWVGIGQLGLISIGSVWSNQQLISVMPITANFTIKREECSWITFDALINVNGVTTRALPVSSYRVNHFEQLKKAFFIYVRKGAGQTDLLIPACEILRACGCLSSELAKALVEADLSRLVDMERTRWVDSQTFMVCLEKRIRDSEAFLIADWASTKQGQQLFESVKRMMMVGLQDSSPSYGGHYQYRFPGVGDITFSAAGKKIPLLKDATGKVLHWGFLVTRLGSWDTAMAYQYLIKDRVYSNEQGENYNDPDLIGGAWTTSISPSEELQLTSDLEPDTLSYQQTLAACPVVFGGSFIKQSWQGKERQEYTSQPHSLGSESAISCVSTADLTGQQTNVGSANIRQENQEPARVVTLQLFIEAIKLLKGMGVPVYSHQLPAYQSGWQSGVATGYFPLKIAGRYSWHLIEEDKRVRGRGFVVASLGKGAEQWVAFELERKNDKFSLLLLRTLDGHRMTEAEMVSVLSATARQGRWPIKLLMKTFEIKTASHPKSQLSADFAQLILDKMG